MGGDAALPFGVADLIFFVPAAITTTIAQGPETNAKASLTHPPPRPGPANMFSTGAREKRLVNLCQTTKASIFSLPWSPRRPQCLPVYHLPVMFENTPKARSAGSAQYN